MLREKFLIAGLSCLVVFTAKAAPSTLNDLNEVYREHLAYVAPMVETFLGSPQVQDVAKFTIGQQAREILANTALTVAYEGMIQRTGGEVCSSPAADAIAAELQQPDGKRAPVMFNPGTLLYVNVAYFRDLCVMYRKAPERVRDLYIQHMTQIKRTTGGRKQVIDR